ncbi:MAG: MMPL family transporter [Pseudomonadota bacterium]
MPDASNSQPDNGQGRAPQQKGGLLERVIFNARMLVVLLFIAATGALGYQMTKLESNAAFEKMVPSQHPYIENFLEYRDDLGNLSNVVRVIVVAKNGDILNAEYLDTLKQVSDDVFYLPGVDRGNMKSLWTPNMRWLAVTKDGFEGDLVISDSYDGSPESLEEVRRNILRSGEIGRHVGNDFRSTVITAPLADINPETGQPLDYGALSRLLEEEIRDKYSSDEIEIRIVGFAKLVGDLIDGIILIAFFFVAAVAIMGVLLFLYLRCLRSTMLAILCSAIAVVWQLGLLTTLGYGLDPYSVLVPFLIFAIGASHAIQIINATMLQASDGHPKYWAARRAFRALVAPGATALISDSIGFLTLIVIPIAVIGELAVAAGLGVAMVFLTNLILLPVLLSYSGVSRKAAERAAAARVERPALVWRFFASFSKPLPAACAILIAIGLAGVGVWKSADLQIGDLDKGAPELHPDSRYNLDVAYLTANYSTSTDVMVIMATTDPGGCARYPNLQMMDTLQAKLENLPVVQNTFSIASIAKLGWQGTTEGNLRWRAISRNQLVANNTVRRAPPGVINHDCSMASIIVFLTDHKATTLIEVTDAVNQFSAENDLGVMELLLAAGNSGIEAATNEVISEAQYQILALVYGVVAFLILITFRSLTALVVILTPLALTSVLGQALMASLGMGVKVATLPVIALGVGIGVDYGIYIYDRLKTYLDEGYDLNDAYLNTVRTTGAAVAFTGVALAVGVATWILAPTKFQADMGLMLTFMFLWNMLGAMTLLPALMRLLGAGRRSKGGRAETAPEAAQVQAAAS